MVAQKFVVAQFRSSPQPSSAATSKLYCLKKRLITWFENELHIPISAHFCSKCSTTNHLLNFHTHTHLLKSTCRRKLICNLYSFLVQQLPFILYIFQSCFYPDFLMPTHAMRIRLSLNCTSMCIYVKHVIRLTQNHKVLLFGRRGFKK
jgi:hypothetical protein